MSTCSDLKDEQFFEISLKGVIGEIAINMIADTSQSRLTIPNELKI